MSIQKDTKPKTRTSRAKTKQPEQEIIVQEQVNLPVLKNSKGSEMALTVQNIQSIGSDAGQNIGKLADQVLNRVKVSDTGELGEGINNILNLTRKVDVTKLGKNDKGIVARIWNIFGDTKQQVLDQFETSSGQIEKISTTLQTGIDRMQGETVWLSESYTATIDYLYELEDVLENVLTVKEAQDLLLKEVLEDINSPMEKLDEQRMICDALDKQTDKLRRLIQLAKLTAPQIGSMRAVNLNTIEKFNSLSTIVIPAWKNNMSLGLISLQQSKDNELSDMIDNETNRLLADNAKNVSKNMKDSAAAAQRGIVDLATLNSIQNDMLSGIRETIQIENKGREDRKQAAIALQKMDNDLKEALREITVKKSS